MHAILGTSRGIAPALFMRARAGKQAVVSHALASFGLW